MILPGFFVNRLLVQVNFCVIPIDNKSWYIVLKGSSKCFLLTLDKNSFHVTNIVFHHRWFVGR